jgi:hypothetical protein
VDNVPPFLRKSVSGGNRTRTYGSVARISDHWTTQAIYFLIHKIFKFSSYLTANTIHLRFVARISDHWTTHFLLHKIFKFSSYLTANTIHLRSVARYSDHWSTQAVLSVDGNTGRQGTPTYEHPQFSFLML